MKTSQAILAVTVAAFLFGSAFACRPIIRFIESECCGDDYVEIAREWVGINDEPNITAKGIQNRYLSTCPEGVWMGYEHENYTGMTSLLSGRNDGLNNCRYENTGRRFRSAKIVGSTSDFNAKALVIYTARWEEGEDRTFFSDISNLNVPFDSAIIMGNEEVEFFTSNNFGGLSVCVRPNNGYINGWSDYERKNDITNGTDLYTVLSEVTNTFGTNQFHSVKFGCRNSTNTLLNLARYAFNKQ